MEDTELTENHITNLVRTFYDRVRLDELLGPVFAEAVHDWDHHEAIIMDFWSRVLLGTFRYQRQPFPAHMRLSIQQPHFERWLELFRETARETLPADAARIAIGRAEFMAQSFLSGLSPLESIAPFTERKLPGA